MSWPAHDPHSGDCPGLDVLRVPLSFATSMAMANAHARVPTWSMRSPTLLGILDLDSPCHARSAMPSSGTASKDDSEKHFGTCNTSCRAAMIWSSPCNHMMFAACQIAQHTCGRLPNNCMTHGLKKQTTQMQPTRIRQRNPDWMRSNLSGHRKPISGRTLSVSPNLLPLCSRSI